MRKITLNVLKSVLAEVFVTGSLGGGTLTGRGTLLLPANHGADGVRTLLIQSLSLHCNPGPYAAEGVEAFFFFYLSLLLPWIPVGGSGQRQPGKRKGAGLPSEGQELRLPQVDISSVLGAG